jgi:hypothetical protein
MSVAIDWTQAETSSDIDAAALERRRVAVNAECERRIFAIASANAQRNMGVVLGIIAATPAGDRTNQDVEILAGCRAAMSWVNAMRSAAAHLRETDDDFTADAAWPDLPDGVGQMLELI